MTVESLRFTLVPAANGACIGENCLCARKGHVRVWYGSVGKNAAHTDILPPRGTISGSTRITWLIARLGQSIMRTDESFYDIG